MMIWNSPTYPHDFSNTLAAKPRSCGAAKRAVRLPSPPPDEHATEDHHQRHEELTGGPDPVKLGGGHRNPAIFSILRTNRDQILIGREPVNRVQGKIAVPVECDK